LFAKIDSYTAPTPTTPPPTTATASAASQAAASTTAASSTDTAHATTTPSRGDTQAPRTPTKEVAASSSKVATPSPKARLSSVAVAVAAPSSDVEVWTNDHKADGGRDRHHHHEADDDHTTASDNNGNHQHQHQRREHETSSAQAPTRRHGSETAAPRLLKAAISDAYRPASDTLRRSSDAPPSTESSGDASKLKAKAERKKKHPRIQPTFTIVLDDAANLTRSTTGQLQAATAPASKKREASEQPADAPQEAKRAKPATAAVRCQYWPSCARGDACLYHHPTEICTYLSFARSLARSPSLNATSSNRLSHSAAVQSLSKLLVRRSVPVYSRRSTNQRTEACSSSSSGGGSSSSNSSRCCSRQEAPQDSRLPLWLCVQTASVRSM